MFQLISACQDREFLLRVSYMEVWHSGVGSAWLTLSWAALQAACQWMRSPGDRGSLPSPLTGWCSLCCPALQLYNEDINDLLAPENQKLQVGGRAWGLLGGLHTRLPPAAMCIEL